MGPTGKLDDGNWIFLWSLMPDGQMGRCYLGFSMDIDALRANGMIKIGDFFMVVDALRSLMSIRANGLMLFGFFYGY